MKIDNDSVQVYLSAIAFRFTYLAKDLPSNFANFEAGQGLRTPLEILRHMTAVLNFAYKQFENIEEAKPKELD